MLLMLFSRAAAQATAANSGVSAKKKSARKLDAVFAGDILLKFKHSPKVAESGKERGEFIEMIFLSCSYE